MAFLLSTHWRNTAASVACAVTEYPVHTPVPPEPCPQACAWLCCPGSEVPLAQPNGPLSTPWPRGCALWHHACTPAIGTFQRRTLLYSTALKEVRDLERQRWAGGRSGSVWSLGHQQTLPHPPGQHSRMGSPALRSLLIAGKCCNFCEIQFPHV